MKKIFVYILVCFLFTSLLAQERLITGVVNDVEGSPMPFVNIGVKGTARGTMTDDNGRYSISVTPQITLVFSFIGYITEEIPVGNQTVINVILLEETTLLEEVIVVGYGTQQKASVVGAISSVRMDEISNLATANISNTLGGRVPGMITVMGQGRPGDDDATIRIRGVGTVNQAAPLILIDGIEGDMNRVNPNDIESFTVLKDASATAVYGVRGANGVILITTKRGRTSKPVINFSSQYRLHNIVRFPNYLGSYDYARLYNEARLNDNLTLLYTEEDLEKYRTGSSPYTHPDINWKEAMTVNAFPEQRYDISLRGGTELVKYFISAEYLNQEGSYRQFDDVPYSTNSNYQRFNLRMNYDFQLTTSTTLMVNLNGRIQDRRTPQTGDNTGGGNPGGFWDNIAMFAPNLTPLINPDGSIAASPLTENQEYARLRAGGYQLNKRNNMDGRLQLTQKLDFITEGLGMRLVASSNTFLQNQFEVMKDPPTYIYNPLDESYTLAQPIGRPVYGTQPPRNPRSLRNNSYTEVAMDYNRRFEDHAITGLALFNQYKYTVNANPFTAYLGFAGRTTYAYKDKYLAEINLGYNGSTQFVGKERFALFPSYSLGWVISEEGFFRNTLPWISFLKFRGSTGTVGNDQIGNFQFLYLAAYEGTNNAYGFGESYNMYGALSEASLANENVGWEIARKNNAGLDLTIPIRDGLFMLSFDYFIDHRTDILRRRQQVTSVAGVRVGQLPAENIGKVDNKGFEIDLSFRKNIGDWRFMANANFTKAENKIIYIDEVLFPEDYRNQTGKPVNQQFGFIWTGEFYTYEELGYLWDETLPGPIKYYLPEDPVITVPVPETPVRPGDIKFLDRNGDGVINSEDFGTIGYPTLPQIIYGLNTSFGFKRFTLNMFWQGATRVTVPMNTHWNQEFLNNAGVQEMHKGRWAYYVDPFTNELIDTRATATYPRLSIGGGTSETSRPSTFNRYDGTYLRLKNIELQYNLSDKLLQRIGISSAAAYITASNVLTFSKIDFADPEVRGTSSFYPQTMFFGGGFSIGL